MDNSPFTIWICRAERVLDGRRCISQEAFTPEMLAHAGHVYSAWIERAVVEKFRAHFGADPDPAFWLVEEASA